MSQLSINRVRAPQAVKVGQDELLNLVPERQQTRTGERGGTATLPHQQNEGRKQFHSVFFQTDYHVQVVDTCEHLLDVRENRSSHI